MNSRRNICCKILAATVMMVVGVAIAQDYQVTRSTIDGGGMMHSTGGELELSGTIGQSDAGVMTSGGLTLTGGFWFEVPPGDCQEDGDVDLNDTYWLTRCLLGPQVGPPEAECLCFDVNRSWTIDLVDLSIIQSTFTGP